MSRSLGYLWIATGIIAVAALAFSIIGEGASLGRSIAVFCFLLGASVLYFLPAIIAMNRGHHNVRAIFALDLLAAWSIIGWIIALVWAYTAVQPMGRNK